MGTQSTEPEAPAEAASDAPTGSPAQPKPTLPEGFSELGIPGGQLVVYVVLAAVLGVFFAIFPARRAARLNVLEAISYE